MTLIHDLGIRTHKVADIVPNRQAIRECKTLLEMLSEGVYSMGWDGPLPKLDKCEDYNSGIMEIVVRNKFNIHRVFQLKKQGATRKIKIWNNDVKCIESWTTEEVTQLNSRLADIINGTYYY